MTTDQRRVEQAPPAVGDRPERARRLRRRRLLFAALAAFTVCFVAGVIEVRTGLQFTDESWVWYGVQRTVAGEVPIGDFQSYDPGRYFWSAAWAPILGDGIVSMRISTWIFAAIGLTVGLVVAQRLVRSFPAVLAVGVMVLPWMIPRHKRFDFVVMFPAMLAALGMIERRDDRSHLYAGCVAGAAAFIGRNNGLYLIVGLTALAWFLAPGQPRVLLRRVAHLWAGAVIGYTPMIILILFRPHVLREFVALNLDMLRRGTSAPLPVEWPWRADSMWDFLVGLLFVVIPLVYALTAVRLLRRRRSLTAAYDPLLLAATAVGVPALHHAFSHAEINHMAQVIAPFLLLVLTYVVAVWRRPPRRNVAVAVVVTLAVFTALVPLSRWRVFHAWRHPEHYTGASVGDDELIVDNNTACHIDFLHRLDQVAGEDALFVGPAWPGVYALTERRAPHRFTYMAWKRDQAWQRGAIEDLVREDVRWAWIHDVRNMRYTHPDVMQYIERTFKPVALKSQPAAGRLFARGRTVPVAARLNREQPGPCPPKEPLPDWQTGW